jgi:S1-C subfamily serine protease
MNRSLCTIGVMVALLVVASPAWVQESRSQDQSRPYLGAAIDSTARNAPHAGAMIREISPNSPAEKAGLKQGDIVTKVGDKQVQDADDLANGIHQHKVGEQVTLTIMRDGNEKQFSVTLLQRPADWMRQGREPGRSRPGQFGRDQGRPEREFRFPGQGMSAFLGVQTRELTPDLRKQEGVAEQEQGVFVADVVPNSAAATAGIKRGDVITAVQGKQIATPEELRAAIQRLKPGDNVSLKIKRGNKDQELTARLEESPVEFGMFRPPQPQYRSLDQNEEIQDLQRRVRELEQRLHELEKTKR